MFSVKKDTKTIGGMLASRSIMFPKQYMANTKCGVVSPNFAHRKRQPLCIKQLPLMENEVLEHISVRSVNIAISPANARFSAVDFASADTEFSTNFGLYHTVHVAVQNSKF